VWKCWGPGVKEGINDTSKSQYLGLVREGTVVSVKKRDDGNNKWKGAPRKKGRGGVPSAQKEKKWSGGVHEKRGQMQLEKTGWEKKGGKIHLFRNTSWEESNVGVWCKRKKKEKEKCKRGGAGARYPENNRRVKGGPAKKSKEEAVMGKKPSCRPGSEEKGEKSDYRRGDEAATDTKKGGEGVGGSFRPTYPLNLVVEEGKRDRRKRAKMEG